MLVVEVGDRNINKLSFKLRTNLAVNETTPNLIPVLVAVHTFLQPVRVISKSILFIPSPRNLLACAFVSNDKGENRYGEDEENQEEHDKEVSPEKPCDSATGTNQTSDCYNHEENSESDHGFVQETLTLR